MKKLLKARRVLAFTMAFTMVVSGFIAGLPASAFASASSKLATPGNFDFEYTIAGDIIEGEQNPGIGPAVENGNRALVWDEVPGAVGYIVYAFDEEDETDPEKAFRSQRIDEPFFRIGHESVTQARTKFNDTPGEQLDIDTMPVNEDGELSWGAMFVSSRQDFDLPLPYREFYFRVVAVAADEKNNSDMSDYVLTLPGARSSDPMQSKALIEDAKARGAAEPYFIYIQTGTLRYLPDEDGVAAGGIFGRLYVPFSNTPTPNPDYLGDNIDGATNRSFIDRITIEIENHPAYIGPETLIFSG